jgi:tellurium resistance protein TerD
VSNINEKDKAKIGGMFINSQNESNSNMDQRLASGKVLHLRQGDKVVLQNDDNTQVENISLGVGWSPSRGLHNMDLDASVIAYANKSYRYTVYYGELRNSNNSIIHHGDNLIGSNGKSVDENDEDIDIKLNKLTNSIDELFFVVNIYSASSRGQSFGTVKDLYIRVYNNSGRSKVLLLDFVIDQGKSNSTGVVIGKIRKSARGWVFSAVGEYGNADDPSGMRRYCRQ